MLKPDNATNEALRAALNAGELALPEADFVVGLVTTDPALAEHVGEAVRRGRGTLLVARERREAQHVLNSDLCDVCVVDYGSTALLLRETLPATINPGGIRDDLVLTVGRRAGGIASGEPVRAFVYGRAAVGRMLSDLMMLLPGSGDRVDFASRILGDSAAIHVVREQVRRVARFHEIAVLILGETGTGKELVANAIHELSSSAKKPFVAINCAAIPESLFESELFGHEAGSYTGARTARAGLLESAADGTVFLDEVGEMPASMQPKLLRALETRTFRRVGSNRDLPLRARIVSATHRGTPVQDDQSTMRADLYYRLSGFSIVLPPLRERLGDVPLLARAFLDSFSQRHGLGPKGFSVRATEALTSHGWPGNVRELRAVVEHAAILSSGPLVDVADVAAVLAPHGAGRSADESGSHALSAVTGDERSVATPSADSSGPVTRLRDLEQEVILRVFREQDGNVSRAVRALGISRTTLRAHLKRLNAR